MPLDIHDKMSKEEEARRRIAGNGGPSKDYKNKMPRNIGGGEGPVVSVARALATNPELTILMSRLQRWTFQSRQVISTLIELQKKLELSYLFITHDLSLMRNVASRVAILYLGRLCELAPTAGSSRHRCIRIRRCCYPPFR